ncbi:methyltransferase family protein [Bacillus cereus]|uniref:methyltransferase family protein n=1 Tax=Bacillus cereus TaxID=1396 RepID=UPI00159BDA53|nr:isoprenylcysteine carboxylmethyltransferase family protein [Bacillus cereus]
MNFFIPCFFGIIIPGILQLRIKIKIINNTYFFQDELKVGSIILGILGLGLMFISAKIIYSDLDTPLWDKPPSKLVKYGPYKYTRNPMTMGMLIVLMSESIFFNSFILLIWFLIFFMISQILIIKIEEPSLSKKFGDEYTIYQIQTPRWFKLI